MVDPRSKGFGIVRASSSGYIAGEWRLLG
jgi:hypothetical protein